MTRAERGHRLAARLSAVMGQRVHAAAALRLADAVRERTVYRAGPLVAVPRPGVAWQLLRREACARTERLCALYLDAQNGLVLRCRVLSVGSLNICRTHPREVFWPAIGCGAAGVILAHNHPSGCLEPSPEDECFTREMHRAGELLGIDLYDHLILTRGGYTSLRERGVL